MKRKCRLTPEELKQHETAVRVRNMTDKQLCEHMSRLGDRDRHVREFLNDLEAAGIPGIDRKTIAKLYAFAADKEGYLRERSESV